MRKKKNESDRSEPAGGAGGCGAAGAECHTGPPVFRPAADTKIKKTIAVMSGKGGVGKSAVTMMLAVALRRKGFEVGVLDADITGPSVPRGLGVSGPIMVGETGPEPPASATGIKVMSMNLILDSEDDAVIWRGPLISSAVGQFYQECEWGDLDYLLIDLPPGTADVPLTVMQSIHLDGIVLVSSPQELAGMIVGKAVSMAGQLNAPITGLIENMSYVTCPSCGEKIEPFGPSHGEEAAAGMGTVFLGRLPLDSRLSELADAGRMEDYRSSEAEAVMEAVIERFPVDGGNRSSEETREGDGMKVAVVMSGGEISSHFGRCEEVLIAEVEGGEIKSREVLPAPPHDCSALPNLFVEKGVTSVIAGGMGAGAIQNLQRAGVRVYAGVSGSTEEALKSLAAGTLVPGAAVCAGGEHHDGCAH